MNLRQITCVSLCALTLALGASSALAQHVGDCGWQARADAIPEPWDRYSRTFSNGAVRIALLDTVDPAMTPFHLLVLSPPFDELGGRQCRVLSFAGGVGFADLDFAALTASYDPQTGLTLGLPGRLYDAAADFSNAVYLSFDINQATGKIDAQIALGQD